jgi:hypothetical protein
MLKYGEPPIADANTGRIPGEPLDKLLAVLPDQLPYQM